MTTYYYVISDNATTTLAANFPAGSNNLQVLSGSGALFPVLTPGTAFIATLIKNGSPSTREVIEITAHAAGSDNFTGILRDLGGTGQLNWNAGDTLEMRPCKEIFQKFAQLLDVQVQHGNYATDVGSANAYRVNLTPPLNARVVGMPIRFQAAHANTGASTFDDGSGEGPAPLVTWFGNLRPNNIVGGSIHTAVWDGTYFELRDYNISFTQLLEQIGNGQVPLSAVLQWESFLAIAFSQLTGLIQSAQLASNLALPGSPTTTTQSTTDSSTKLSTTAFANPALTVVGSNICINLPGGKKIQGISCNPNGGTVHVTYPVAFTTYAFPVPGSVAGSSVQTWLGTGTSSVLTGVDVSNTGGTAFLIVIGE